MSARAQRGGLARLLALNLAGLAVLAGFVALGTWQVQRRAWKLDLIARVEARVHAPPVPAPGPADWPDLTAQDAYRHVALDGRFLHADTVLVQALTERGGGFWVLTPLRVREGLPGAFTVLVNRGFVPGERRDPSERARPEGEVWLAGLLRPTEPGGGFLRSNAPEAGRWYSRDVAAIARAEGLDAKGLGPVAPYFVDAEAGPDPERLPVGGLTVVTFRNDHLVYALTWYALAAMSLGALVLLNRDAFRAGRGRA